MKNNLRRLRRRVQKQWKRKPIVAGIAAALLLGSSFALASGSVIDTGNSLLAAATTAITGRPTVLIGISDESPQGSIKMGANSPIAIYNISAKNVTHWASVRYVSLQMAISQNGPARLDFTAVMMKYTYCIPEGVKYGYGYVSKGCGSILLMPDSVGHEGNDYVATFNGTIPVYPQQTTGTLTLYATPKYAYTGTAVNPRAKDAEFRVRLTGAIAMADQCRWGYNPTRRAYGYVGCVERSAVVNIFGVSSYALTVARSYGYGYNPSRSSTPSPSFSAAPSSGMAPLKVDFANVGSSISYGDGQRKGFPFGPAIKTISHTYEKPGTYTAISGKNSVKITVTAPSDTPAPTCTVTASKSSIGSGTLVVTWTATNAASRTYTSAVNGVTNYGPATIPTSGSMTVAYEGFSGPGIHSRVDTVTGPGGTAQCTGKVTVLPPGTIATGPAPTCTVKGSKATLSSGQQLTITWTATNATSRTYTSAVNGVTNYGPATIPTSGSMTVAYEGFSGPGIHSRVDTVTGPGGTAQCTASVTVNKSLTTTSTGTYPDTACPNTLGTNASLSPGQNRTSCNGRYTLWFQSSDNNIALYDNNTGQAVWTTGTAGQGGSMFYMQGDGNLVLYAGGSAIWASSWKGGTIGKPATLKVEDNGTLTVTASDGSVLWSS